MSYAVNVPGDRPVTLRDWRAVEAYLYPLERTDWKAYIFAIVEEEGETIK